MKSKLLLGAALAAVVTLAFASAPITAAVAHNMVKCSGVTSCNGMKHCKAGKTAVKTTAGQCKKLGGKAMAKSHKTKAHKHAKSKAKPSQGEMNSQMPANDASQNLNQPTQETAPAQQPATTPNQ